MIAGSLSTGMFRIVIAAKLPKFLEIELCKRALFDSKLKSQPHKMKLLSIICITDSEPKSCVQNTFDRTLPS